MENNTQSTQEEDFFKKNVIANKMRFGSPDRLINHLVKNKTDFYVRRTTESTEVISSYIKYMYSHSTNFPTKKLYVFGLVKKDALKWLEIHDNLYLPPEHKVSKFSLDYDHELGEITATDINNAYWSIALREGIISQSTYEHGLDTDSKALRLASLSVLGRPKVYEKFENGKVIRIDELRSEDENLKKVYKYIRYTCYQMMYELSVMLGDDFDCWKTDCIYYRRTEENINLVQEYFTNKNLSFKQLYMNVE